MACETLYAERQNSCAPHLPHHTFTAKISGILSCRESPRRSRWESTALDILRPVSPILHKHQPCPHPPLRGVWQLSTVMTDAWPPPLACDSEAPAQNALHLGRGAPTRLQAHFRTDESPRRNPTLTRASRAAGLNVNLRSSQQRRSTGRGMGSLP